MNVYSCTRNSFISSRFPRLLARYLGGNQLAHVALEIKQKPKIRLRNFEFLHFSSTLSRFSLFYSEFTTSVAIYTRPQVLHLSLSHSYAEFHSSVDFPVRIHVTRPRVRVTSREKGRRALALTHARTHVTHTQALTQQHM